MILRASALSSSLFIVFALFSTWLIPGPDNILGTSCITPSGYLCQNPVYDHFTGNIIVTLGQITGTNWTTSNFVFVPQGTQLIPKGIPSVSLKGVWGQEIP